ncbi:MAG: hemerythrin domain-containing protein [Caulobacteraceae bacterium]|nr:hemerythrin domain-containing protein [Caulobacteraceae bacterium]
MPDPPATSTSILDRAAALEDADLIRLIIQYHDAHLRDLAAACDLAERLAQTHRRQAAFLSGLAGELERLLEDLRRHQEQEEAHVFPHIVQGRGAGLALAAGTLATDHEAVHERLERLVRRTGDFTPPPRACELWRELYGLCRKFDREFRQHAQLEERVLFPRLRT